MYPGVTDGEVKNCHVYEAARTSAFAVVCKYRFFQTAVRGTWVVLLTGGTAVFCAQRCLRVAHSEVEPVLSFRNLCSLEQKPLVSFPRGMTDLFLQTSSGSGGG